MVAMGGGKGLGWDHLTFPLQYTAFNRSDSVAGVKSSALGYVGEQIDVLIFAPSSGADLVG